MIKTIFLLAAVAAVSAITDCNNGNFCQDQQTCVSHALNAGMKWGCSPLPQATVCRDSRFSCPSGHHCNETAMSCFDAQTGKSAPIVRNVNANTTRIANGEGVCEIIASYLPSFCTCQDKSLGGIAQCQVNMLNLDTVGLKMDIEPCADPAHVNLDVTEADLGIDYPITGLTAGEDEDIPIPGLSINIPVVGDAGVNAVVDLDGNVDQFTMDLGLDACAEVMGYQQCGSKLTSELPVWVLQGTFSFGDMCEQKMATEVRVGDEPGCCGARCTPGESGDCAAGLFCCPNHYECMDDTTKSTQGPNCDACQQENPYAAAATLPVRRC